MAKAEIYYFSLTDEMTRKEKLEWFENTKFEDIPFDRITPDEKHNWINLTDNDFDQLLPLIDKEVKVGKSEKAIFKLFSRGVETGRDEWVYAINSKSLEKKMKFFSKEIQKSIKSNKKSKNIKWNSSLDIYVESSKILDFNPSYIGDSIYRPFYKVKLYRNRNLCHRLTQSHYDFFGISLEKLNQVISCTDAGSQKPFMVMGINVLPDLHLVGAAACAQCLPLYRYNPKGDREDNITDWGLQQIQTHYNDRTITKPDIFHYTYAILHHPTYRQKYEINLKRDFPRLPLYADFHQWADWGKKLMDWHINYETIKPYGLKRQEIDYGKKEKPGYKVKLKADKQNGQILLDTETSLIGIPELAWSYQLGNRSAIEWVLEQYKEKIPKDLTIRELFNNYRFIDYKEQVIDLLDRVCSVSIKTMKLINEMPAICEHQSSTK